MSKLDLAKAVLRDLTLGTLAAALLFTVVCFPFLDRRCYWCHGVTLKPINFGSAYEPAKESILDRIVNNRISPEGYTIHFECFNEKTGGAK